MRTRILIRLLLLAVLGPVAAAPLITPGDIALRHDIQRLADYGIIKGPVSTWPLAWGPIFTDISNIEQVDQLPGDVLDAISRLRERANAAMRIDELRFNARASVAGKPTRLRSFQDTPRESAQIGAGFEYTGERFAISLNGQAVASPDDDQDLRADGSMIGVVIGNYTLSANTLDRWWGPGWDGSLILSNNARPIPAFSFDRNFTDGFKTKWLSWLGPWDLSVHYGQMEDDREVPNARFFGMRINFKPFPSLEIGLSRSAQWCGEGRPCDFSTFIDMFLGRDNQGDSGITPENEPGNQLAGVDIRWATRVFDRPVAFYTQLIGEDEAGGFPSRYLGQFGLESTGMMGERWSYRWFGEFAATSCSFWKTDEIFNCAYNHSIYKTGYRYRGRVVGQNSDNDSRVVSAGLLLVDDAAMQWQALVRYGKLNRGGAPDERNSLTPTPQEIASIDLTHSRFFRYGEIRVSLGLERIDDTASGQTRDDVRAYLEWRNR